MKPLDPSDAFLLQAAQGWLELGNHVEAAKELEGLAADLGSHPAVLKLRWGVYRQGSLRMTGPAG